MTAARFEVRCPTCGVIASFIWADVAERFAERHDELGEDHQTEVVAPEG